MAAQDARGRPAALARPGRPGPAGVAGAPGSRPRAAAVLRSDRRPDPALGRHGTPAPRRGGHRRRGGDPVAAELPARPDAHRAPGQGRPRPDHGGGAAPVRPAVPLLRPAGHRRPGDPDPGRHGDPGAGDRPGAPGDAGRAAHAGVRRARGRGRSRAGRVPARRRGRARAAAVRQQAPYGRAHAAAARHPGRRPGAAHRMHQGDRVAQGHERRVPGDGPVVHAPHGAAGRRSAEHDGDRRHGGRAERHPPGDAHGPALGGSLAGDRPQHDPRHAARAQRHRASHRHPAELADERPATAAGRRSGDRQAGRHPGQRPGERDGGDRAGRGRGEACGPAGRRRAARSRLPVRPERRLDPPRRLAQGRAGPEDRPGRPLGLGEEHPREDPARVVHGRGGRGALRRRARGGGGHARAAAPFRGRHPGARAVHRDDQGEHRPRGPVGPAGAGDGRRPAGLRG